jgi:hypothetical protein
MVLAPPLKKSLKSQHDCLTKFIAEVQNRFLAAPDVRRWGAPNWALLVMKRSSLLTLFIQVERTLYRFSLIFIIGSSGKYAPIAVRSLFRSVLAL